MEKYIGIVAHDAGGANILASYCRRKPDNYRYLLQGPAKAIFEKTLSIESEDNFGRFVSECHSFICGTSGKSDLERSIFAQARILNKETTAVLDHWINYRERFLLNGKLVLPNNLITVDRNAYQIAKETFPECKIEEINNPYLEEFYNHYKELTLQKEISYKSEILYISEGFSEHKEEGKNGLSKDLKYFKEFLHAKKLLFEPSLALRIRLHPSEDLAKLDQYREIYSDILQSDSSTDLAIDLSRANCVVGVSSMALVLAAFCGIPTFSLLSSSKESKIPTMGINYIGALPDFE
jgi:hypothetical protein